MGANELVVLGLVIVVVMVFVIRLYRRSGDADQPASVEDVSALLRQGWRVEHETGQDLVLVRGRRVNHILHLLLCVLTVGLWAIIWILLAITGGEKRKVIAKPSPEVKAARQQAG